ncbi:hypothetical protein COB21_05655 [Candidatus Aerophobetes bacterium]|uniref:Methyltransferase small domain-containing protein n=1 Tax=Aerophobetes bacterium TaxID=2030807 RepID=A0A2A4WZ03_UNCAE|nr:MAG: hypothetical protein COB21_05655 [Candidatus Aerophobetes bacterium]
MVLMDIDAYWKSQWESFCPHFSKGVARVNLHSYGGPDAHFKMLPGGGFGDLSHPTTKLCLTQICKLQNQTSSFIDIGCGSGVLSLAAHCLGFSPIFSIDIEDAAIAHIKKNSLLNNAPITVGKTINSNKMDSPVIVMNMIEMESSVAWKSCSSLHNKPKTLITSGILTQHKQRYLNNIPPSFGRLTFETSTQGWSLFVFKS